METKTLLKRDEVADVLRVSERTVRRIEYDSLPFIRIRGRVRYKMEDVEGYIARNRIAA